MPKYGYLMPHYEILNVTLIKKKIKTKRAEEH